MKRKEIWSGILVLVLVFGMMVMGCDDTLEEDTLNGHISIDNYYPIVGETITATWSNDDGYYAPKGTPKWEWFRGSTPIREDINTYTVVSADVGNIITVKVSFSGETGSRESSVGAVLNTPATATISISMEAYGYGRNYYVEIYLKLSDGRWNRDIKGIDIFDTLVTLTGTPADINLPFASEGWHRWNSMYGVPSSFGVTYTKSFDSVPSINLTATIDPAKVAGIRSSTNVYNSLTVGSPSTVSVSEWTF